MNKIISNELFCMNSKNIDRNITLYCIKYEL